MDLPKYPFAMATDKRHGQVLALRGMRETPIHAGIYAIEKMSMHLVRNELKNGQQEDID